jgi:hypothetical protein
VASSDAQNAFSTGIGANPHGGLPARETSGEIEVGGPDLEQSRIGWNR